MHCDCASYVPKAGGALTPESVWINWQQHELHELCWTAVQTTNGAVMCCIAQQSLIQFAANPVGQ